MTQEAQGPFSCPHNAIGIGSFSQEWNTFAGECERGAQGQEQRRDAGLRGGVVPSHRSVVRAVRRVAAVGREIQKNLKGLGFDV